MPEPTPIGPIAPFFIVRDLPRAIAFYRDQLGFEVRFQAPSEDPFFAIVGRDAVEVHLKVIDASVAPQPNPSRHEWAAWDAFVFVNDPDALAGELETNAIPFHRKLENRDDGLRGFEVRDHDGYVLFFGRPTDSDAGR